MRKAAIVQLFLISVIVAAVVIRLPAATSGQVETCGGDVIIANGGFEYPAVPAYAGHFVVPTSWVGIGAVVTTGPNNGLASQSVRLDTTYGPAPISISQSLSQADLPGSTATFTLNVKNGATLTFAGQSQDFSGNGNTWVVSTLTFNVPNDATLPLVLTLSVGAGGLTDIDSISATYTKTCPSPTPTETPIPTATNTPVPTATPTQTPEPTATPTQTPESTIVPTIPVDPTATSEPASFPDEHVAVTADPRFPIIGTMTIPGYDSLTYALDTPPSNGTVTVAPDGYYAYIASNIWLAGDVFTILATAPNGETATITVTVVYAIDPSVPTTGTVSPSNGGVSGGGSATEPRHPGNPSGDDDGGGTVKCPRCN